MQKFFVTTVAIIAVSAQAQKKEADQVAFPLNIKLDGENIDLWMHQTHWSDMSVSNGNQDITMNNRDRAYISWSETPEPYSYFTPDMLGGYMTYDVDLSQLPCGCITAMYQVMMPAKQENGELFERDYWYCGAQQSKYNGMSCPEFDIMEANTWGFHTTAHACEAPTENGWYPACDLAGQCVVDIEDVGAVDRYGPGAEFDINTLLPYNVRLDYQEWEGHFVGYTTTMTQGDQQIVLKGDGVNCRNYLDQLTQNVSDGMAFVMSSWNPPSAKWLQGDRCNEKCEWPVQTTFSNIEFWTAGAIEADPIDIQFGGPCAKLYYGQCGDDCAECNFSWPKDEPLKWKSKFASCRCKDDSSYKYGNPCGEEDDTSNCHKDCKNCNKSWSPNDPDKWLSADMECRCVPEDREEITYGDHRCQGANDGICGDSCDSCRWSWPTNDSLRHKSDSAMCRCADNQ